jgi:hypothetical protein
VKFFRDGSATQYFAAFQDHNLAPGPGKIAGADEAVVATTDDDDIIRIAVWHCAGSAAERRLL